MVNEVEGVGDVHGVGSRGFEGSQQVDGDRPRVAANAGCGRWAIDAGIVILDSAIWVTTISSYIVAVITS